MTPQQAKKLAPFMCAYADGSEVWYSLNNEEVWYPVTNRIDWVYLADDNIELRKKPKPPATRTMKIALFNGASVSETPSFPFQGVVDSSKCHTGWIPVKAEVAKGNWNKAENTPGFIKWLSTEFQLVK